MGSIIDIITLDIFIGYGLYSIMLIIVLLFVKDNSFLDRLDISAGKFIIFCGIMYFMTWVTSTIQIMTGDNEIMISRIFGLHWYGYWIQPLLWTMLTQLFWFNRLRQIKILRLIISMLLIISFERYVIIITSLYRDYAPSNWGFGLPFSEIITGLSLKTFIVIIIAYIIELFGRIINKRSTT